MNKCKFPSKTLINNYIFIIISDIFIKQMSYQTYGICFVHINHFSNFNPELQEYSGYFSIIRDKRFMSACFARGNKYDTYMIYIYI